MSFPAEFPPLPLPVRRATWRADILHAHDLISSAYTRAANLLRDEHRDPLRLRLHADKISSNLLPILTALCGEVNSQEWLEATGNALGALKAALEAGARVADGTENTPRVFVTPITIQRRGGRGRPRKFISHDWLANATSPHRKISLTRLAKTLGIHRHTLRKYLKEHGIDRSFSTITDAELDVVTEHFKVDKPGSGLRYLSGHLRYNGLRIQRERVRRSLRRIDSVGRILRQSRLARREYTNPRPNAVWHMDGHHKLIKYGIVIHGIIDGHDRTAVGIHAATNNRAQTVLDLFLDSVEEYGAPARVRGDRGGETIEVSVWMVKYRGPNRGSFIWGGSGNNTRAERQWVEVGAQFVRFWHCFFIRLRRLHQLDRSNPHHLWLLHYLFLSSINDDCARFQNEWNHHPVSGLGGDQTPLDMRMLGILKNGLYTDDFQHIHPKALEQYGHLDDIDEGIAVEQTLSRMPFENEQTLAAFEAALWELDEAGSVPSHIGVAEAEWVDGVYPEVEWLKVQKQMVRHTLPFEKWFPRAVKWAQGLTVMKYMQAVEQGEL